MATIDIYDKSLTEIVPFLETIEAIVAPWGGRQFRVIGDHTSKTLPLKEIVQIVFTKCQQAQRPHAPLLAIAAIKHLDQDGNAALLRASLLIRILTYIRQFFGNFFFNKQNYITRLTQPTIRGDDFQLLVDQFNRHPIATPTSIQELITHLKQMGEILHVTTWNNLLQDLSQRLSVTCPVKAAAIAAFPDNGDPLMINLKLVLRDTLGRLEDQQPQREVEQQQRTVEQLPQQQRQQTINHQQQLVELQRQAERNRQMEQERMLQLAEQARQAAANTRIELERMREQRTEQDNDFNNVVIQYNELREQPLGYWYEPDNNQTSTLWVQFIKRHQYSPLVMERVFNHILWDEYLGAKILDLLRSNPELKNVAAFNSFLTTIKGRNPQTYSAFIKNLIILAKDIPDGNRLPALSDEEYLDILNTLWQENNREHPYLTTLIMQGLFRISWNLKLLNSDQNNFPESADRVDGVIVEVIHHLLKYDPAFAARTYMDGLDAWNTLAAQSFQRLWRDHTRSLQIPTEKETRFKEMMNEAVEQLQYNLKEIVGFWDYAHHSEYYPTANPDWDNMQHDTPFHKYLVRKRANHINGITNNEIEAFLNILEQGTDKKGIFYYYLRQRLDFRVVSIHGENRPRGEENNGLTRALLEETERLLNNVPENMFSYAIDRLPSAYVQNCINKLLADQTEKMRCDPRLLKFFSENYELRDQYYPGYTESRTLREVNGRTVSVSFINQPAAVQ